MCACKIHFKIKGKIRPVQSIKMKVEIGANIKNQSARLQDV